MNIVISSEKKGVLSLILLALVFASMGLFARFLNTKFLLFQQIYLRVFVAFILAFIIFYKDISFSKLKNISIKEWLLLIIRSLLNYLIGITLFTKAINLTKYSNVSFIGALPIIAILGIIIFKEKLNLRKFIFIILAFIGVVLITVKDYSSLLTWGEGEIIALLATIFFGLGYLGRKWHSDLLNNKEMTLIMLFIGFVSVFIVSLIFGESLPTQNWHIDVGLVLLAAGLFNILNMSLVNYGFKKVRAILASNILTLEAVFSVILGFLFYAEFPNLLELSGGGLIILSVLGMNNLEANK